MSEQPHDPQQETALAVAAPAELERFRHYARSISPAMFGLKTINEAITIMLIGDAEGVKPIVSLSRFDVIHGRPAKKAVAMLDDFKRDGGRVTWLTRTDAKVTAKFTAPDGDEVTVTWDDARVKQAGLSGNHTKYPAQMKSARCVGEAMRAIYPKAAGLCHYVPEELAELEADGRPRGIGGVADLKRRLIPHGDHVIDPADNNLSPDEQPTGDYPETQPDAEPDEVDGEIVEDEPAEPPERKPVKKAAKQSAGKHVSADEVDDGPADDDPTFDGGLYSGGRSSAAAAVAS